MKHSLALILAATLIVGCSSDESSAKGDGESSKIQSNETPGNENIAVTIDQDAAKFIGAWIGHGDFSDKDLAMMRETMSESQLQNFLEMAKEVIPTFELFGDGTYRMTIIFLGAPFKDTWRIEGDTLILASSGAGWSWSSKSGKPEIDPDNLKEEDMVPNKEPMILRIEADGTELVMIDETGEMTSRMVYTKE